MDEITSLPELDARLKSHKQRQTSLLLHFTASHVTRDAPFLAEIEAQQKSGAKFSHVVATLPDAAELQTAFSITKLPAFVLFHAHKPGYTRQDGADTAGLRMALSSTTRESR